MMTDLRFALRQLLKSPGLTFLALITVALGIKESRFGRLRLND
jgi:hypothetical protein